MAKNIEPNLKLISSYLKLNKPENFVIPEYQRAYSWNISQCDKLWQDIESFISSDAIDPYFFGTIIVDCSDADKFSLIDGQQRTTTFLLLLKALLLNINLVIDKIPNDEDSEALKAGLLANRNKIMAILYKAEDEEIPAMLKDKLKTQDILIIENNSINELHSDEVGKIIASRDFITAEQNVYKFPRKQKDNRYTNYFRNFNYFYDKLGKKSESELNYFSKIFLEKCQVIEIRSWQIEQAITMFNSLNSTGLPLSDADVISAKLYSKSGENKLRFNENWEEIKKVTDELNQRRIVDIDGVLQQFMYIDRALNKEYLNKGSIDVTTPGLRRYYIVLHNELLDNPLLFCDNILKIANTWELIKDFSIVKLLLKFNENAKLFLASYLNRYNSDEITEDMVLEVGEQLLRLFAILELVDLGYSSSKFKTFLFGENINLVDSKVKFEQIKQNFNSHINTNWEIENLESSLLEYEKNTLVYLNEYLFSKSISEKFTFEENVNIEHIMPASGRNEKIIQNDAGINDSDEFKSLVNKLGNKILLEEDVNKSLGKDWFKTKKQNSVLTKKGYKDSKFAIARSLLKFEKDTWEKEDIEKATKEVAQRILNFIFNKK